MSIPEPRFDISVYQLDAIIKEVKPKENFSSKMDYFKHLKGLMYEYLDTI